MPSEDQLSDDYVASLLAKDAKASNAKYSAYGLQDLLPKRPTYNAPKPNTRFLKNIIRETDSHNAALRAKEASESRLRLRKLRDGTGQFQDPQEETLEAIADIATIHTTIVTRTNASALVILDDTIISRATVDAAGAGPLTDIKKIMALGDDPGHVLVPDRALRGRKNGVIIIGPIAEMGPNRRRLGMTRKTAFLEPSPTATTTPPQPQSNDPNNPTTRAPSPSSDSDPLEALIGPPPPPSPPQTLTRGRGTFASTKIIDTHFSTHYDPTLDVQPDPSDADDWDMALEALRDRQKWQKQGAERLKAAGFSEEEVQKWEKGGEKREEDVRWRGRGEGREWDRGKVVREEGVETGAEWGRLKGN